MTRSRIVQLICVVALTLIATLGPTRSALAQKTTCPSQGPFELDAGQACSFKLLIESTGGEHRVCRTFTDKNDNPVRFLQAGDGFALTFTNRENNNHLSLPASGSTLHTTVNADGTTTNVATGHNVLILFPTDVPAGPSTVLYKGQVVYTADQNSVFTLKKVTGNSTDICAALL